MAQQQLRNDQFFDAPVELFFTVNLAMGISTKMDSAMMIQKTMITAKARDIYACPQAVWNHFHVIVLNRMKNCYLIIAKVCLNCNLMLQSQSRTTSIIVQNYVH